MRFSFWIITAVHFLRRSGRITTVLSVMLFSALAALVFLSSLAVGINDAMIHNSVSLYSGHITGFDLPESVTPKNLRVTGVKHVLKRIPIPGILSATGGTEALTLVGINPEEEITVTALWEKDRFRPPPETGRTGNIFRKGPRGKLNRWPWRQGPF
jgi:hypothetical protein